jgi:hypothetical protein
MVKNTNDSHQPRQTRANHDRLPEVNTTTAHMDLLTVPGSADERGRTRQGVKAVAGSVLTVVIGCRWSEAGGGRRCP